MTSSGFTVPAENRSFVEVLNQNREVVMSLKMVNFMRRRHGSEK